MEIDRVGDRGLLGRVFREARPFWPQILGLFLVSVLATPLALLGPVPLKIAVDSVLGSDPLPFFLSWLPQSLQGSTPSLLVLAAVFQVAVVLLMELQALAASVLETSTSENLTLSFRGRLLGHLQRLSFSFHDARGTADSIYRIQHMLRLDTQLALIALAISPLLYLSVSTFRRRVRPGYRRVKRLESHALAIVQEVLTSFRVVKAFGREREESQRFLDHSRRSMQIRIRLAFAEQAFQLIVRLITAMGTATVLFVGVRKVQSGVLSLGELLMVIAYVGQLYTPLRSISKQTTSLEKHLASAQRAFGLLEEVPEVVERPGAHALGRAKGAIRFRDVCFGYEEHELILRDVSFEVPVGTRLGIVGPTGAGKTTLVSLISRLYDPTAGQILLDDTDLRDYKLDDLRNQFAIMLQDPVLFSTSIAENIAYARPGAAMHEIVAASRAAGAHGFISAFEDGYETIVGERGMRLSGGERQRISLARAFLKDAPLLILDEPTSSVDVETESMIMEAFEQLMKDRTTLMIAHRTSTLERCDLILQVENQRVAIGPPARSEPPSASPRALPGDRERRGDGA
jgi:ATP-binding cassette subfamily B protein